MQSVSANEAKQSLGRVIDSARREPVMIRKHNRPAAVILSIEDFNRLRGANVSEFSAFCDEVGRRAKSRGMTKSKLEALLAEE